MLKKLVLILLSFALLILTACSEADLSDMQRNVADPDFTVFTLVEGYPSLEYIWDNMNSKLVNERLSETMDNRADEFVLFSEVQADLIRNNPEILTALVAKAGTAMATLLDEEEKYYYSPFVDVLYTEPGATYQDNFYNLLTRIGNAETDGLRPKVMGIARNIINYIVETNNGSELNKVMGHMAASLADMDRDDFVDFSKILAKVLIQGNYSMYLDGSDLVTDPGDLIVDPDDIGPSSLNTKLGNMTKGIVTLLDGAAEMVSSDPELKSMLFDLLDEVPVLYAAKTDNGKDVAHVMQELVQNIEALFLPRDSGESTTVNVGGENFDRNDYYKSGSTYLNSDLKTTVQELLPALQKLMISAGKNGSIIHDTNGNGDSALEVISGALKKLKDMGIDLKTHDVRDAINDMVTKDANGNDRPQTINGEQTLSALDHLLFTLMASNSVGYKDGGNGVGTDMSNNWGHQQGAPTGGVLTVNDSLAAMGSHLPDGLINFLNGALSWLCGGAVDMDTYSLALENPAGDSVFRSKDDFNTSGITDDHHFYLHPNYPANYLLSGNCVGDGGVPNGGYGLGDPGAASGMSYMPYDARGIGEQNTGRWVLGWLARSVWEGEGPYYSVDNETIEGDLHTVYRPDGTIYAVVDKSTTPWTFSYPKDASYDADIDNGGLGDGERDNHFKYTWETDAFLIENDGEYFAPGDMSGNTSDAGRFTVNEIMLPADYAKRECATQEEAMVKNFQWLLYEKKFLHVMPLRVVAMGMLHATIIIRLEGNGIAGVANVRKSSGDPFVHPDTINHGDGWKTMVGDWCRLATESSSCMPGSGRIIIDVKEGDVLGLIKMVALDDMVEDDRDDMEIGVWDEILGSGHVLPDIVGANFGPMERMAFLIPGSVYPDDVDANWDKRSSLFPVLAAIIGELHKRSYYETPSAGNYAFNNSPNNKYPFKLVSDALIPALAKPFFYYQVSGTDTDGAWKPQVVSGNFLENEEGSDPTDRSDEKFQPKYNRSLVSLLAENGTGAGDGLLSLLNKTEMVPKLFAMLQKLSESSFDDIEPFDQDDMDTWGIRRKVFYSLEQLMTGMKVSKSKVYEDDMISSSLFENWQFQKRDCDLDVDKVLDGMFWENWTDSNSNGLVDLGETYEQGTLAEIPDSARTVTSEPLANVGKVVTASFANDNVNPAGISFNLKDDEGDLTPLGVTISNGLVSGSDVDGYGRFVPATGDIYFMLKEEPEERLVVSYSYTHSWDNFYDAFGDLGNFLEADSEYFIWEDLTGVMESALDAMTYDENLLAELKGALYTLGKMMGQYDGSSWMYQGEEGFDFLYLMMKEDLPTMLNKMLDTSGDNAEAILLLVQEMAKVNGLLDGILDSVDAMNVTDVFTWAEIFEDLNALLQDPLMTETDSDLWPVLADMLEDMAGAINSNIAAGADGTSALEDLYSDFGFQYNGN